MTSLCPKASLGRPKSIADVCDAVSSRRRDMMPSFSPTTATAAQRHTGLFSTESQKQKQIYTVFPSAGRLPYSQTRHTQSRLPYRYTTTTFIISKMIPLLVQMAYRRRSWDGQTECPCGSGPWTARGHHRRQGRSIALALGSRPARRPPNPPPTDAQIDAKPMQEQRERSHPREFQEDASTWKMDYVIISLCI